MALAAAVVLAPLLLVHENFLGAPLLHDLRLDDGAVDRFGLQRGDAGCVVADRDQRNALVAPALLTRHLADDPAGDGADGRDADALALQIVDGLDRVVVAHHQREGERRIGEASGVIVTVQSHHGADLVLVDAPDDLEVMRVSGDLIIHEKAASMGRRGGGHVGIVSGIDANGNPIVISGNHGHRVAEATYARGRIYAYVMPTS